MLNEHEIQVANEAAKAWPAGTSGFSWFSANYLEGKSAEQALRNLKIYGPKYG